MSRPTISEVATSDEKRTPVRYCGRCRIAPSVGAPVETGSKFQRLRQALAREPARSPGRKPEFNAGAPDQRSHTPNGGTASTLEFATPKREGRKTDPRLLPPRAFTQPVEYASVTRAASPAKARRATAPTPGVSLHPTRTTRRWASRRASRSVSRAAFRGGVVGEQSAEYRASQHARLWTTHQPGGGSESTRVRYTRVLRVPPGGVSTRPSGSALRRR